MAVGTVRQVKTRAIPAGGAVALLSLLLAAAAGCAQGGRPGSSPAGGKQGGAASLPPGWPPPGIELDESGGPRVRRILSRVRREYTTGLEGLSASGALALIDRQRFYDYPRFEEELTTFLRSLGELRIFVREVDVQLTGDRAVMLVEARLVFASRLNPAQRGERRSQVTFDFQLTERGWRITEIHPRDFFLR